MEIVNEKIGIKDLLSSFAELVFPKKENTKKDNEKELEEKLNEVYKAQEELGATQRIKLYEQDIEKHIEPKTRSRKTLVREIKPKQDAIHTQQPENNKENEQIENENEKTIE